MSMEVFSMPLILNCKITNLMFVPDIGGGLFVDMRLVALQTNPETPKIELRQE
jgi:hypothetical protein